MAQTVLTTGANSGIGLATVLELARRGFRSVGSVRSEAKAKVVRQAAEKAGLKVQTVLLDVDDPKSCERAIRELRPWGLVNNAGYAATGAVEDVGDDDARSALETMVIAPMRLSRLALPYMRRRGDGRIINVSSIYGRTTTPLTGWYQASKHALEALSDALRTEVASAGVKVILIEPGGFRTGLWDDAERVFEERRGSRYEGAYKRSLQSMRWSMPLMGNPERVARVITNVMSTRFPRARYLVGYDAQMLAMVDQVVPTPVKDWMSRMVLGL
jgi:NAD(P)-dependent dehydrogenase (short-subunit alcohol dehydrogenase family)